MNVRGWALARFPSVPIAGTTGICPRTTMRSTTGAVYSANLALAGVVVAGDEV